ncbi:uncharacterized protein LOC110264669 [Arachis ipaensis]|uniref:uncharacterized protein LOC110264669 n=1 Tax=Arachis ipaensis TaxID=130454 RepID=UPI000A2B8A13|nr:uncharacterized protein LOC110264669 [Arachis ipaensis]
MPCFEGCHAREERTEHAAAPCRRSASRRRATVPVPPSFGPSASRRARLRERETREGENGSEAELRSNHRIGVLPRCRRTRHDLQPRRCQLCLLCRREAHLLLGTLSPLMGCASKPLPPENITAAVSPELLAEPQLPGTPLPPPSSIAGKAFKLSFPSVEFPGTSSSLRVVQITAATWG